MKSYDTSRLLLLVFLCGWDSAQGHCALEKQNAAKCADLEDARYIDTYHLHALRASSSAATLAPGNFKNLTSLRHLDLSNGNIETIETGSFAKLASLASLNLGNNSIAHLDAGAFDGLKQLRNLKLTANKIRQLPAALMSLGELRYLDVADNPLNCNCASMKLRDALVAHGVKISMKTRCAEPIGARGTPLMKPDTRTTCAFEAQDTEMQADQPVGEDGSGDEDDGLDEKDFEGPEKEVKQPEDDIENETAAPPELSANEPDATERETSTSSESPEGSPSTTTTVLITIGEVTSTEADPSSTSASKDETTDEPAADREQVLDLDTEKKEIGTPAASPPVLVDGSGDFDDESSGEMDDEGSGGSEASSMISPVNVPEIDFNDRPGDEQEATEDNGFSSVSTTAAASTTADEGWWGVFNALNPFGTSETTTVAAPTTTEKNPEEQAREEEFIPTVTEPAKSVDDQIAPRIVGQDDYAKKLHVPAAGDEPTDVDATIGNGGEPAPSQETQKGSGSYYVLAALLAILAVLIAFAAYKGDFCRNKRKHGDVERGTEMKDMHKSLLEQNAPTPKIQVSNGSTMENVPLMNSTSVPEEPKDNQKSYDITPARDNDANRLSGLAGDAVDPVKPPRKGYPGEIEAPLNGLNPPMDDIDGPDGGLPNGEYGSEDPALSPGAQRVKITMGELPESVPKTPILITRLSNGDNLVKAP